MNNRIAIVIYWLAFIGVLGGQQPAAVYQLHEPIELDLSPPVQVDQVFRGTIEDPKGVSVKRYPELKNIALVWAPAGKYEFKLEGPVVKPITFTDQSGKQITIDSFVTYLKHSWVIEVKGSGPVPPGPQPPNPPGPTPPQPDPQPDEAPIPGPGLKVLIVYENDTLSSLSAGQLAVITSTELRTKLSELCAVENGQPSWRVYDQDVILAATTSERWKNALKRPRQSLPWIIVSNEKTGYEGPLPKGVKETLELVEKYK